jgi:hypothetical protein
MYNQEQIDSFNARVARIQDPRNKYYLDPETGMKIPKRVPRDVIRRNRMKNQGRPGLVSLTLALLTGGICLMVARFASNALLDVPLSDDIVLLMELAGAAIIAFVVGGMVNQKTMRHMLAQIAGACIMTVAMHNLVWMFPNEFAMVYSQAYVDEVRAETQPNTLYLRGTTINI